MKRKNSCATHAATAIPALHSVHHGDQHCRAGLRQPDRLSGHALRGGLGDGAVLNHAEWHLLGLGAEDTLAELKQIALRGEIIVQSAAGLVQISWKHKNMEELANAITHS